MKYDKYLLVSFPWVWWPFAINEDLAFGSFPHLLLVSASFYTLCFLGSTFKLTESEFSVLIL